MVSLVTLVIIGHRDHQRRWTNSAAECSERHSARANSDEPDAVRPTLKSSDEAPESETEYETGAGPD